MSDSPEAALKNDYSAQVRRVTFVGSVVNVLLTILQLVGGIATNSRALIADSVHSLSDLLSDAVVIIANKLASAPPDDDHPYGHGKYETLGTIFLSALLCVTGVALAFNATLNFDKPEIPSPLAIFFAFIGLVAKEGLYHYTMRVGKALRSQLLIANAWHHRSDAVSSMASFVGIAGAVFINPILDAVAALIVGLLIFRMGLSIGWQSLQELLDAALEDDLLEKIQEEALKHPKAKSVHNVRARRMGPYILVDFHLDVPAELTILEAHSISELVEHAILDRFSGVTEVLIHLDPVGHHQEASQKDCTPPDSSP
ncbi:MAG: cation diffusion facilitator family transporter [Planctomycetota bacterium]|nr:cation diffusion facilitator family transporter [Planctomycetota bacterium]